MIDNQLNILKEKIEEIRLELGFTQARMGKMMGFTGDNVTQAYGNVIKGGKGVSMKAFLTLMVNLNDLDVNYLLFEKANEWERVDTGEVAGLLEEPETEYKTTEPTVSELLEIIRTLREELRRKNEEIDRLRGGGGD